MTLNLLKTTAILIFCFTASVTSAQLKPAQPQQPVETKFPDAGAFANSNISYKIINAPNHTYGYDIIADKKLLIHQPSIPGASGNNGFAASASAEKVAQLVITKIKKGEMPPTVTLDEMKKLKAIN